MSFLRKSDEFDIENIQKKEQKTETEILGLFKKTRNPKPENQKLTSSLIATVAHFPDL